MKKIFKLFLCLLMFFSFTNLTILLAEGDENKVVSAINVTGIVAPVDGESATTEGIATDTEGVHISIARWYLDEEGWMEADPVETFVAKQKYLLLIAFELDEGYTYAEGFDESNVALNANPLRSEFVRDNSDIRINYEAAEKEAPKVTEAPVVTVKNGDNNSLVVNWTEVENAERYIGYYSKDGKKFTEIYGGTATSVTVKGLIYGKKYYFKVKAKNYQSKTNKTSAVVTGKTTPNKMVLSVKSVGSNNVKLTYDKVKVTGYVIYSSTDNKEWDKVATISKSDTLEYNVKSLKSNKKYYFRARAYKTVDGEKVYGKYSDVVEAKTAPAAPKLEVGVNTYKSLKLTTTEVKGAVKYILYRSTKKDGTYTNLNEVATSFVDDDLTYGKTYYYKVKACNEDNKCGSYSSIVSAKVDLKKPKITVEATKTTPVTIKVSKVTDTEGYVVYRSTDNKKWDKLATVKDGNLTYIDKTSKKNKTYYYRVRSFVTIDEKRTYSAYSDVKSIKALYTAPKTVAEDFTGKYATTDYTLNIFAENDDYIEAKFSDGNAIYFYLLEFENYKLVPVKDEFAEEEDLTINLTNDGVSVTSTLERNAILVGNYTRTGDFTLDEYFEEIYPAADLTTKYNGVFDGTDGTIYLFQYEDNYIFINENVEENHLDYFVIDEGNVTSSYGEFDFVLTVNDDTLTLKKYNGEELLYEKTFTKVSDISKSQILNIFGHVGLK